MTSASRNYPPEWRARRDAEQAKLLRAALLFVVVLGVVLAAVILR